jgi:anti-sigma-K factor RskA
VLTAPGGHTVTLAPTPDGARTLTAELHYDPASDRALLFAQGFAPPGAHDYELWAITAAGPTSLGVVHAGPDGRAVVRLDRIARDGAVAAFAVSLEASGGSPDPHKPSGPVVMLGKLAG